MNNQRKKIKKMAKRVLRLSALLGCLAFLTHDFAAQQRTNVSELKNQASATYSDGTNDFSTVSNDKNIKLAKPLNGGNFFLKNSFGICSIAKSDKALKNFRFLPEN